MNEKSKLMAEIILLAMKVQRETKYCVFIRYSGHVENMEITIAASKNSFTENIATSEFKTEPYSFSDNDFTIERMESVKETLLAIIDDKKVDVSQMDYEIEEVKHYIF